MSVFNRHLYRSDTFKGSNTNVIQMGKNRNSVSEGDQVGVARQVPLFPSENKYCCAQ